MTKNSDNNNFKSLPGNIETSAIVVPKVRRVLGVDPGLASTGFGIVDFYKNRYKMVGYGVIETPAKLNHGQRLLTIYEKLCKVIEEFNPSEASMETLFFAKNVTSAMGVAEARGVVTLCFAQKQIPLGEYTPNQIKQAVTGTASADKELVQKYVEENLDVKALQKNIELLKISLNASRLSTFTPSLSVSYGFQPVVAQIDSDWVDTYIDNGSFSATVVIDVMKMMPFSANMQSIKDTKQNLAKAELGLSQLLQNTEIQIHTLVDKLNKSEASIKASQMNIKLAQKAYDMTVKAYNSGTQELLDVKDSENSLSQAKLGLLNEKLNYISALLDLENAINVKLVTK